MSEAAALLSDKGLASSQRPGEYVRQSPWLLFVLALSVLALLALVIQRVVPMTPGALQILEVFDLVVCAVFLIDFISTLVQSKQKVRYLLTWGWLDLLSSIPTISSLRWARSARIVRILRLLRALRAARMLTRSLAGRRSTNGLLGVSLFALIALTASSIAVLQVETAPESNIRTAEDALWWSLSTMTTVGCGDRYPVTSEGRFVAALLMVAGVGLFGTLSGLLAAWFIAPAEDKAESELGAIRKEIAALREAIEKRG